MKLKPFGLAGRDQQLLSQRRVFGEKLFSGAEEICDESCCDSRWVSVTARRADSTCRLMAVVRRVPRAGNTRLICVT